MKYIIFFLSQLICVIASSQDSVFIKEFKRLKVLSVQGRKEHSIYFETAGAITFNKKYTELSKKPFEITQEDMVCEQETWMISKSLLDKKSNVYVYVTYGECPVPEYYLYDANSYKLLLKVYSSHLAIPGNGFVYSSSNNGSFDIRRLYTFKKDSLIENVQPLYAIGFVSKTLKQITIYQGKDLKNILVTIADNQQLEIVAADKDLESHLYLVKTSSGLIGWARLEPGQFVSADIKGLLIK